MIFSLDVLRAEQGDCLVLHYGSKKDPHIVVIDGGPGNVYKNHLKPRLLQIREERKLAGGESVPIDLMMVSHIDDDHINGLLDLTKEQKQLVESQKFRPFEILKIWHNTFDELFSTNPQEFTQALVVASLESAAPSGDAMDGMDSVAAKVLASVNQGRRFRDDAKFLSNPPTNTQINEKLIMAVKGKKSENQIDMRNGLKFVVVGPMEAELQALQAEFHRIMNKEELEKKKQKPGTSAQSDFSDNSVANLSSLVLLAEAGKNNARKRILLTGDARGDKILEGLETVKLLKKGKTMRVDILKMPHHGSDRNMDEDFLKRVTADHYVFSGNGEYGNPERATLEWLRSARGNDTYKIHLTYPIDEIDENRKKNWEAEREKEMKKRDKNKDPKVNVKVREEWSEEKHSLTSLFEEDIAFEQKLDFIKIVGEPHVIDLLDEKVGF